MNGKNKSKFFSLFIASSLHNEDLYSLNNREKGVVVNEKHKAAVGELVGDGCSLFFSNTEYIGAFEVCLRVSSLAKNYPVGDFGYIPKLNSEWIYPLGVNVTVVERFNNIFYCTSVDYSSLPSDNEGVVRLFAINRIEYFENKDDDFVSQQTKILMYFLGVCYCLLVPLLLVNVVCFFIYFIFQLFSWVVKMSNIVVTQHSCVFLRLMIFFH